ncbi:hypothetical protein HOY80DRAFT_998260 [Tuber brumale]|nr:hypothetical protein HOY80DRAFT_998260 [Tuber brumale]
MAYGAGLGLAEILLSLGYLGLLYALYAYFRYSTGIALVSYSVQLKTADSVPRSVLNRIEPSGSAKGGNTSALHCLALREYITAPDFPEATTLTGMILERDRCAYHMKHFGKGGAQYF